MVVSAQVELPRGIEWGASRARRVAVTAIKPADARALLEEAAGLLPAERTLAVLARAVSLGDDELPMPALASLSVGELDRLLVEVQRLAGTERVECLVTCACDEVLEFEVPLGAFAAHFDAEAVVRDAEGVSGGGTRVVMRAAEGGDLAEVASIALHDPDGAVRALVERCLLVPSADELSDELVAVGADLLAGADAAAEIVLSGPCPNCGVEVQAAFDPTAHVWRAIEDAAARLEHDVHLLAATYHWAEADIVVMPEARRARYVARLTDAGYLA